MFDYMNTSTAKKKFAWAAVALFLLSVLVPIGVQQRHLFSKKKKNTISMTEEKIYGSAILNSNIDSQSREKKASSVTLDFSNDSAKSANSFALRAYSTNNIIELEALMASAIGSAHFDFFLVKEEADRLCNMFPYLGKRGKGTFVEGLKLQHDRSKLTNDELAFAEFADEFREKYCAHGTDKSLELTFEMAREMEQLRRDAMDASGMQVVVEKQLYKTFDDEQKLQAAEMIAAVPEEMFAALQENLEKFISQTDSPAGFREATQEILTGVETGSAPWNPPGLSHEFASENDSRDHEKRWRKVGNQLAFCSLAGASACGPGSVILMSICVAQSNCRRGESYFLFVQRTESPQTLAAAYAYANALLAMRRR